MKRSIQCPSCLTPLGTLNYDSIPQLRCTSCQRKYGVVYGKLSQRNSMREVLLYLTAKLPRFYKRHYEFRIITPSRSLQVLKFSVPGAEDGIPVRRGDMISLLYTTQGYVLKKLIAITNHTTGSDYLLPSPVPSPGYLVATRGTVSATVFLSLLLTGANIFLLSMLSAASLLLYAKLAHTAQLTSPPLQMNVQEESRLLADQKLLTQKYSLEQRLGELKHESAANQALISQLGSLKRKMLQFDDKLYANRIRRTTSAVGILSKQMSNNQRLVSEYSRMIKMIEIEVETAQIADQLPDAENFTKTILRKLAELKHVEEYNQNLRFQLEANEEVRRMQA
ncbi:hypothetical protein NDA01_14945 [Trichocoleus desertorum AS-A10]|uniref:hypothetical protein n=1 Tax=Trichocoleus desertorum TaxID=1481672 RepID=UPI0032996D6D